MPIRIATHADASACAAIYAHYVHNTVITFETQAPTLEEMSTRIATANARHAWMVAESESEPGKLIGYAYGGTWKTRAAYRWSCEVSVYLDPEQRGGGWGKRLYTELFERLAARGYLIAIAGMTLPNPASAALHRHFGFVDAGLNTRIGFKNGAWHDVQWMQRTLAERPEGQPPEPR